LRNTIEGLNGYAKDTAHQALAQPARRRVRGIAAQSIFTALLLIAANIRKVRAWRALTARDKTRITQRARRRRSSLRDYLPDGRQASAAPATLITYSPADQLHPGRPATPHPPRRRSPARPHSSQRRCQSPAPC
jgi:hypothetical protein